MNARTANLVASIGRSYDEYPDHEPTSSQATRANTAASAAKWNAGRSEGKDASRFFRSLAAYAAAPVATKAARSPVERDQPWKVSSSPSKVKRKNHERSAKKPSLANAFRNDSYFPPCQTEMPVRKIQMTEGIQTMAASFERE